MTLTESSTLYIGILDSGQLEVRRTRVILDGGTQIAEQHHRHVINPGDNLASEDPRVQAVAAAVWTEAVLEAYRRRPPDVLPGSGQ